ncbi:MAG: hypothetical protein H0T42_17575 [Deltaproteobacteria bacterium]|nr:hypothetical protein [Deltaproteobacteria bacterium]
MRASDLLIVVALAAGCSKKADKVNEQPAPQPATQVAAKTGGVQTFEECTRFVNKALPVIEEMTKKAGMPFGPGELATFVNECAASTAPREKLMDCVLAAADEPAVRACYATQPPSPH